MNTSTKRITIPEILARKSSSDKITCLTAYDFTIARLIDQAGIDLILVGDSLGSVVQGEETTLPVTLDQMVYHTRCVSRGVNKALVVADLPFMSYQISKERALESAGKLIKEGGASAVKLEGGLHMRRTIRSLVDVDIPVMGHVGLTPQSYHRMGGYKVQGRASGKKAGARDRVIEDALAVEDAGAFAVVLEGLPSQVAEEITSKLSIPTIGIGAGSQCDGQILVINDLLGLNPDFTPKFVKQYATLAAQIQQAVSQYCSEVKSSIFPDAEHSVTEEQRLKVVSRARSK